MKDFVEGMGKMSWQISIGIVKNGLETKKDELLGFNVFTHLSYSVRLAQIIVDILCCYTFTQPINCLPTIRICPCDCVLRYFHVATMLPTFNFVLIFVCGTINLIVVYVRQWRWVFPATVPSLGYSHASLNIVHPNLPTSWESTFC